MPGPGTIHVRSNLFPSAREHTLGSAGGLAVAGIWADDIYGPSTLTFDGTGLLTAITPIDECDTCVTVMPGLVDRHVHLGLVPYQKLAESSVVEVYDLGWDPAALARIKVPGVVVHPGGCSYVVCQAAVGSFVVGCGS